MGKLSNTNPMRESARLFIETLGDLARLCLSMILLLASSLASATYAQAQAVQLPLLLPSAIAFDAQRDLYFVDTGNHVVRKITVAGVVTTVAGNGIQGFAGDNGPATAAELDSPAGLALDAAGDLYIADTHNHRVREVAAATGNIVTVAGTGIPGFSGDNHPATAAQLDLPTAIAIDAGGNLYVADTDNHRVRRISASLGVISTIAGNGVEGFAGDNGQAGAASIDSPNGLAVDAVGNLCIADTHNGRVRQVSAATGIITTVAGSSASQTFGGDGGAAAVAGLALPRGLTIDAAGNLYIADSANQRVRRISTLGTITTVAGQGTETFAGDGTPAITASLDAPRAVAISPTGLLTLSDSQNHRIRQLDAQPAPGPDIHTIAGVGVASPELLSLSGASVVSYGSGTVTATVSSTTNATGSVTFVDTSGGAILTVGTTSLIADSAVLNTSTLAAGLHSLVAIYAGDSTHPAAQSSSLAMSVTPLSISANANSAAILYGQPIPTLGGLLRGVLAQDTGKVSVSFTTSAGLLSTVGIYPVAAVLNGSAAGNYTVVTGVANLSIAKTPAVTTLSASTSTPGLGLPFALDMQAVSTTSGVPTGSITVLDGSTVLLVAPLSGGAANQSTSALTLGAHSLSAVYSGDANFLSSTSATEVITVDAASDFTLTAMGAASQSVPAGSAVVFNFSVAQQGAAMASPITLAVLGAPLGATTSLSPSYLPPGGAVTSFTLTIQTPLAGLSHPITRGDRNLPVSILLAMLLLPGIGFARLSLKGDRRFSIMLAAMFSLLLATPVTGCGNRVNTASEFANAKTYTLTVTGTATSSAGAALQRTVNVTLEVL